MSMLGDMTAFRRALAALGALGLVVALIAFVPSPFALFDLFVRPAPVEVKAPPALKIQPLAAIETFDAIGERPLFNAERKPDPVPPPPEAAKPVATVGDLSQYRLVGVTGDNNVQRALIQKSGGPTQVMKPGDVFEGWTIEKIDATGVAISGGGRNEVLAIPKAHNRAASP